VLSYSNRRLRDLYLALPSPLRDLAATAYSMQRRSVRFGGVFQAQLDELEQRTAPPAEQRLRGILEWAGRDVPYYRGQFASVGFDPARDAIGKLPLVEKAHLRGQPDAFRAESFAGPKVSLQTSGTTGSPLLVTLSREAYQRSYGVVWFHYGWAGIRRGDRVATLAAHPVVATERLRGPFWVRDWYESELLFSSQHLIRRNLPEYADALARFRPLMLRGYPSSLYLLALEVLESGRADIRPRAVFTSSETLLDHQRQAIEAAFDCRVYSYYGSAERVAQMLQCAAGNFHVVTEVCVVEVLDADGSPAGVGQEGELVCTSVVNYAAPLIRYRTGDRGVLGSGECVCGRAGPFLTEIGGRMDDAIVTPDGRHIGSLNQAFKDVGHLIEAQLRQDSVAEVSVNVVVQAGWSPADERLLMDNLRLRLGTQIEIHIRQVAAIERAPNGKFKFVVARVPPQLGRRP